ncbi:hypothetical protein ACP70R_022979 [Stipagrostis hirtigluma subsp. patula]
MHDAGYPCELAPTDFSIALGHSPCGDAGLSGYQPVMVSSTWRRR